MLLIELPMNFPAEHQQQINYKSRWSSGHDPIWRHKWSTNSEILSKKKIIQKNHNKSRIVGETKLKLTAAQFDCVWELLRARLAYGKIFFFAVAGTARSFSQYIKLAQSNSLAVISCSDSRAYERAKSYSISKWLSAKIWNWRKKWRI